MSGDSKMQNQQKLNSLRKYIVKKQYKKTVSTTRKFKK